VRRFEARWLKEETVEEMVKAAWACSIQGGGSNVSTENRTGA